MFTDRQGIVVIGLSPEGLLDEEVPGIKTRGRECPGERAVP
jgi:hypothetical protein